MKTSLNILVLMMVAAGLGCQKVSTPRNVHHDGGVTVNDKPKDDSHVSIAVEEFDLKAYESLLGLPAAAQVSQLYAPLSLFVFAKVDDPFAPRTQKLKDSLRVLNESLLKILNSPDVDASTKDRLASEYSAVALKNCDREYGLCSRMPFFQSDAGSADVLMFQGEKMGRELRRELAALPEGPRAEGARCAAVEACDKALRAYYRQYLLAYHMLKDNANERMALGYVEFASVFGEFYNAQSDARRAEYEYQQHLLVFQVALAQLSLKPGNPRLAQILNTKRNFMFSRAGHSPFENQMFLKASSIYLYVCPEGTIDKPVFDCDASRKVLNPLFESAMSDIFSRKAKVVPVTGDSKYFQVANLDSIRFADLVEFVNTTQGQLLKNLRTDTRFTQDEYLYLVNGLLSGDLSVTDANQFWLSTKQDFKKLEAAVDRYIKMYMIFMIGQTNSFMNSVYSQRAKYTSDGLIQEAVDQSKTIANQWVNLKGRVVLLEEFVNQSTAHHEGFQPLDLKLLAIKKSIKYTSVYPNMMMMMYYLSDVNFEFKIRSPFFGTFTINATKMVRDLFSGIGDIWLYFGNDKTALNDFEILYALHYTLKTEAIAAFGNIPSLEEEGSDRPANVDEYQYFNLILSNIYDVEFQDLVNGIAKVRDLTRTNESFRIFRRLCTGLSDPQNGDGDTLTFAAVSSPAHVMRVGTFPEHYDEIDFKDLLKYTFLENIAEVHNGAPNTPFRAGVELYDEQYVNQLNKINTELVPQIERAENMLAILKDHVRQRLEGEADSTKRQALRDKYEPQVRKIEAIVNKARNNIRAYLSYWIKAHSDLKDCVNMASEVSRARALALYAKEKEYLHTVHSWMRILQMKDAAGRALGNMSFAEAQSVLLKAGEKSLSESLNVLSVETSFYKPDPTSTDSLYTLMNARLHAIAKHPLVPALNRDPSYLYAGFDEIQWSEERSPRFTYSYTDMMFRHLEYYKAGIAPNVYRNVRMPGDLTKDIPDFRRTVSYVYFEDFGSFLRQARAQIGGVENDDTFVKYWKSNVNFNIQRTRRDMLRQVYLMSKIDLYPVDCAEQMTSYLAKDDTKGAKSGKVGFISEACSAKKKSVRVTAADLVTNQIEILKAANLRHDELNMLREMNNPQGLYKLDEVGGIVVDRANTNRETPYFQEGLEKILEMNQRTLAKAQHYFTAQRNVGELLFGIDTSVQKAIKCQYYGKVQRAIGFINDYRDQVAELQRRDAASGTPITVTYGYDGQNALTASSTVEGRFAYFPSEKLRDLRNLLEDFHRNTLGFFDKSVEHDSDEAKLNPELFNYFPGEDECAH